MVGHTSEKSICGTRIHGIITPTTSLCCWPPKLPWSFSFDPRGQIFAPSCQLTLRKHDRTKHRVGTTSHSSIALTHKSYISHQFHCDMPQPICMNCAQQNGTNLLPRKPHKTHLCLRFRQTTNRFVGVHKRCAVPLPLPLLLDGTGLDPKAQT